MEERRIEGLWDCVYCGTKAIKARYDTCLSCGRSRGVETVFYLPDDLAAATLTEEEKELSKIAHDIYKPDWLCEYCGSYNRSDCSCCTKCGGDKTSSRNNYGRLHKLTGKLFGRKNSGE